MSEHKRITVDLDHHTAVLMGNLAKKGMIKVAHDESMGMGEAKLDMHTDPNDKDVTFKANLNMAHAFGFPMAT